MTSDQYTELVGFLGGKFERIDRHFERIDRQFEQVDRQFEEARRERQEIRDEARRHATVLFEQSQANLKGVAEGLELRLERAVEGLTESVRRGFADHEGRIQVLERAGSEPEG